MKPVPNQFVNFHCDDCDGIPGGSRCTTTSSCKGIEYLNGRCEVWTRSAGIGATEPRFSIGKAQVTKGSISVVQKFLAA